MTDITRKRGDTYPIELTITNSAGSAYDITGGSFILTADPEKEPVDATNNIYQITGSIVSAIDGTVTFPVGVAEADHVGDFYYDVQMVLGGVKSTVASGKLKMKQDITKD